MKEWFENKTIALVGNAESLFHKSYGNEIDSHEVVVRLNKAAMLYTHFDAKISHGKRTDIWMMWNANEYRSKFNTVSKSVKKMHMSGRIRNNLDSLKLDFLYPINMYTELRKKAGPKQNPTTGLMALDYIDSCNPAKITVYGFDWKETPTFTDMNRKEEITSGHNYDVEKEYCAVRFFTNKFTLRY